MEIDAKALGRAWSHWRDRGIGLSSGIGGIWYGELRNAKLEASERTPTIIGESGEEI